MCKKLYVCVRHKPKRAPNGNEGKEKNKKVKRITKTDPQLVDHHEQDKLVGERERENFL